MPLALLAASAVAGAQIVLKPSGEDAIRLDPRTLDVQTDLRGGVARTLWTYTFANAERFRGQADFLLKIPKGGVVEGFAYWYNGEKVVARVTEKARAARIYKAIVDRQRDPALVEMVGKDTFRVRIFPIQPDADLKVEVSVVQALSAKPDGATLTLPLHTLGKLERATVSVKGDGKLLTSWGGATYAAANTKLPDLRITQPWAPQALHASLRAARSGGPGGFFVLTLTPSKPLRNRKWRLSGPVERVIEVPTADGSTLLVGRYRKPGTFYAVQGGHTLTLTLPDTVEPNGPATKLWAWNRILRSKDRKEIVGLSLRHGVPSPYTSWIAIPTEERKRMAREIAQAELRHEVARALPRLRRVGFRSPEGRRTLDALTARARALGVGLNQGWSPAIQTETDLAGANWARLVARKGENAPATLAAERELNGFRRLGGSYNLDTYFVPRTEALARIVLDELMTDRRDVAAVRRKRELARLARRTSAGGNGEVASRYFLQQRLNEVAPLLAERVARAQRAGGDDPAAFERLRRTETIAGMTAVERVRQGRIALAQAAIERVREPVTRALETGVLDEASLARDASVRRRETARLQRDRAEAYITNADFSNYAAQSIVWVQGERKTSVEDLDAALERIRRVADAAGLGAALDWNEILRGTYWSYRQRRDDAQAEARRDQKVVADSEALLKRVESLVDAKTIREYRGEGLDYNRTATLRNAYVTARHRGEPADAALRRLVAEDSKPQYAYSGGWENRSSIDAPTRAKARAGVLEALTELDQLDHQTADPAVVARKAELEKRAKELRARMGDPILRVEAPGARVVVAKLPDGSWLALHPAGADVWEGRFDVPPGAANGRYLIPVYADGVLETTVPITVDTAAPKLSAAWTGGRVEVRTDADVRRVAGFTPSGERVELVPEAPGRFAALVPPGTRFVATDGAHNRSDQKDVPGTKGIWTPGVTALARVNRRLWIGTANDGGAFGEEKPDPARPWIKSAVRVGKRLAVREADGTVTLDGVGVRTSRTSTAIAADGDRLLVGTIGGFYDGDRPVFPPALAGVVVTALLADAHTVWLGTQGRGLAEIDRRTGALKWHDERNGLGDDWITCLGCDERGRLVAGTFVAGAYVLDGRWSPVPGTAGTCVSGVDGSWVATRSGTFKAGVRVDPTEATALLVEGNEVWIGTRTGPRRIAP